MVDTRRTGESSHSDDAAGAKRTRPAPKTVFSLSDEETIELGRTVARGLRGGELILLEGDLGLGKTVFAKGIAAGLGIAPEDVTSPSFPASAPNKVPDLASHRRIVSSSEPDAMRIPSGLKATEFT